MFGIARFTAADEPGNDPTEPHLHDLKDKKLVQINRHTMQCLWEALVILLLSSTSNSRAARMEQMAGGMAERQVES
jgi:hypothetical protein